MKLMEQKELQTIQSKICVIRGQRVMLDRDLAELYQVTTGNLNKAVKRNIKRFPPDFMFQLTREEYNELKDSLIFQNGTSKRGGTRKLEFYWSVGRDIVRQSAENKYGSGFFYQLSLDMRQMFPNGKGFSATNLKYMKRWYLYYCDHVAIRQQVADEYFPACTTN